MPQDVLNPTVKTSDSTNISATDDVWEHVAAMDEFKLLLIAKSEFVVPAVVVFVVFYFLLPISVGYFPQFMDKRIGPVNIAYLFALSQFFVAWLIAGLYVRGARKFDEFGQRIMDHLDKRQADRLNGGK
jgi:uncharacterized membrane protein (DUF485 family)